HRRAVPSSAPGGSNPRPAASKPGYRSRAADLDERMRRAGPGPRAADRSVVAATEAAAGATAAAGASAATAATAAFALLGLTDVDLPTADVAAVQLLDRLARLDRRTHLDEAETARTAALAVADDGRRFHRSRSREYRLEIRAGGREGEVSYEQL